MFGMKFLLCVLKTLFCHKFFVVLFEFEDALSLHACFHLLMMMMMI